MKTIILTLFVLFNANIYSQKEFSSLFVNLKEIREKVLFLDKHYKYTIGQSKIEDIKGNEFIEIVNSNNTYKVALLQLYSNSKFSIFYSRNNDRISYVNKGKLTYPESYSFFLVLDKISNMMFYIEFDELNFQFSTMTENKFSMNFGIPTSIKKIVKLNNNLLPESSLIMQKNPMGEMYYKLKKYEKINDKFLVKVKTLYENDDAIYFDYEYIVDLFIKSNWSVSKSLAFDGYINEEMPINKSDSNFTNILMNDYKLE